MRDDHDENRTRAAPNGARCGDLVELAPKSPDC